MNKSTYIILGIIIIIVLGVFAFSSSGTQNQPAATTTPETQQPAATTTQSTSTSGATPAATTSQSTSTNQQPTATTITYTNSGFSPDRITISTGDTVTFENQSESDMWVASDEHPTHTDYDGTTLQQHCSDKGPQPFDSCQPVAPGESWSFTFEKAGEWGYHNHDAPSDVGTVIVQ